MALTVGFLLIGVSTIAFQVMRHAEASRYLRYTSPSLLDGSRITLLYPAYLETPECWTGKAGNLFCAISPRMSIVEKILDSVLFYNEVLGRFTAEKEKPDPSLPMDRGFAWKQGYWVAYVHQYDPQTKLWYRLIVKLKRAEPKMLDSFQLLPPGAPVPL